MLLLLEISIGLLIALFFVTQIIVPGFSKTLRFFWIFRKSKIEEVTNELINLEETQIVNELKKIVEEKKKNINAQEKDHV